MIHSKMNKYVACIIITITFMIIEPTYGALIGLPFVWLVTFDSYKEEKE